jgi:hypothetical protein
MELKILDSIHRPISYLKIRCFRYWILSLSSGGTCSHGPNIELGPSVYVPPEDRDRIQSPKSLVLNKLQEDG